MLNLQQLLERVFQQPNRSSCDKAVLGRIWEAFTTWCQEQFDAKLGVKMLGMGEFCCASSPSAPRRRAAGR